MKKKTNGIALALLMLLLCPNTLLAQNTENARWYAGLQGGPRMAMSTASSFGADKTRCGWSAGVFIGRQFTDIIGIEFQINVGKALMSPRACCLRDNWLGQDGNHYFSGEEGEGQIMRDSRDLIAAAVIGSGFGFVCAWQIVLIVAKLYGLIAWSWLVVLWPMIATAEAFVISLIMTLIYLWVIRSGDKK